MRIRPYSLQNFGRGDRPPEKPADPAANDPFQNTDSSSARKIYTVSQLSNRIKGIFEDTFPQSVWVEGELSDPKIYPSGHCWFDLKDAGASLKSVIWRENFQKLPFRPEQGMKVICCGKPEFYPPRGDVKFIVWAMEPKGIGALQLAFEQLKEKLQQDGLFAEERKRPLPLFPERIGIVTSPTGAAIDDMLKVLRGQVSVTLCPARVQGQGAAEAIVRGIEQLNALGNLDLIIVGRGGGSLEDLWAFNEEIVARAVAASKLPVISAVGHEKDVSISDLVADLRAPTPTRAAEMVLAQRRICLDRLRVVLEDPVFGRFDEWLLEQKEPLDQIEEDLIRELRAPLLEAVSQLEGLEEQLKLCSPQAWIAQEQERLNVAQVYLTQGIVRSLVNDIDSVQGFAGRLHALSPLAVLNRGYSITFDENGKIVREAKQLSAGESIRTKLHRGQLISRVESIEPE